MTDESSIYRNFGLTVSWMFSRKVIDSIRVKGDKKTWEKHIGVFNAAKAKQELLSKLVIDSSNIKPAIGNVVDGLRIVSTMYSELVKGLLSMGYDVLILRAVAETRLLPGASSGSFKAVFEVGLSWDYIYDLPYIPASSIKGVMRSWAIRKCISGAGSSRDKRLCIEDVLDIFGSSKGNIIHRRERHWFMDTVNGVVEAVDASSSNLFIADSYPIQGVNGLASAGLLEPDVMTPHYYKGGKVVKDEFEAQPVPVQFLSITPGSVFKFVIGVKSSGVDKEFVERLGKGLFGNKGRSPSNLATLVAAIAYAAFREGVGAKTSKGYGLLRINGAKLITSSTWTRSFRGGRYRWRR